MPEKARKVINTDIHNSRPKRDCQSFGHLDRLELSGLESHLSNQYLLGEVRGFQDVRDTPNPRLEIVFADRDAAEYVLLFFCSVLFVLIRV